MRTPAIAGCLVLMALSSCRPSSGPDVVVVFAAASLREVVTEIADEHARLGGRVIRASFDATSTLARQANAGARVDVFLAADPAWLDEVGPRERFDWLTNRLVLVVRKEAPDPDLRRLASLALAGEEVPAGRYAQAALERLGVALPARTIYGANVRDVLAKVAAGGAEAGIVYATDVAIDPNLRAGWVFPEESHPPIVYAAGLVTEAGRDLFAELREPWAIAIAERHGFVALMEGR